MLTPKLSVIGVLLIGGAEAHSLRAQLEVAADKSSATAQRSVRDTRESGGKPTFLTASICS
jgi:hypothetical protein